MDQLSEIQFTFNADLLEANSDAISFDYGILPAIAATVSQTWSVVRYEKGRTQEGPATANAGERSAINFIAAFSADYNVSKLFTIERNVNVVTIKFTDVEMDFDAGSVSSPASVDVVVTNKAFVPFGVQSVTFQEAPSECEDVLVTIQTYQAMTQYWINGGSPISVPSNPFTITRPRADDFNIAVTDGTSVDIETIRTPRRLFLSGIILNIVFVPSGSSVTVTELYQEGGDENLTFQYSMNGTDWQASNNFTDLLPGSYTMYVRDQFNCITVRSFSISGSGISVPFHSLSKSNPIRFKYNVVWGDNANYKNDENTLSCESDVKKPYKEIQHFQSGDNSVPFNLDLTTTVIASMLDV